MTADPEDPEDMARRMHRDRQNHDAEQGDGLARAVQDADPSHQSADGEDATEPEH